ncbi:MAG: lysylphosphatidylglycerol synthase transmembrane domain-containing protein [Kiritimatiellaeota bacterium]|nr:lysylphosphatidylglycerol synthase transmembrane domain-containing protein [Kiritimatiellota bacterium]
MKRWQKNLLKLAFIAACFAVIFSKIHPSALKEHFAMVAPGWVLAAWLTVLAEPVLVAVKCNLLLREKGINLGLLRIARIVFTSNFLCVVVPVSVGADALRLMMVTGAQQSFTHTAGSLVADRILGALAIMTLSLVGVAWAGLALLGTQTLWTILIIAAIVLTLTGVLLSPLPVFWVPHLKRRLEGRGKLAARVVALAEHAVAIHDSLRSFRNSPGLLVRVFSLNLLAQMLRVVQIVLLFCAVGHPVEVRQAAAFVPMINMFTLLPISYFGLGVKEGAFLYFFGRAGLAKALCLTVSFITYPLILGAMLPGALFALLDALKRPAAAKPS